MRGTVKFFNVDKHFGFISPDNGGADVFVFGGNSTDQLYQGDRVSYVVRAGRKGPEAAEVVVITDARPA